MEPWVAECPLSMLDAVSSIEPNYNKILIKFWSVFTLEYKATSL